MPCGWGVGRYNRLGYGVQIVNIKKEVLKPFRKGWFSTDSFIMGIYFGLSNEMYGSVKKVGEIVREGEPDIEREGGVER